MERLSRSLVAAADLDRRYYENLGNFSGSVQGIGEACDIALCHTGGTWVAFGANFFEPPDVNVIGYFGFQVEVTKVTSNGFEVDICETNVLPQSSTLFETGIPFSWIAMGDVRYV